MDFVNRLPDTHAGRHTAWLWSQLAAMGRGSPPPDPQELAEHFAPSVFEQIPANELMTHWAQIAQFMPGVTQLKEEVSSAGRYSALVRFPDSWWRYSCLVQEDEPHLIVASYFSPALDPSSYRDRRVERGGRDVQLRDFGGTGPLVLVWHGAGGDASDWESLVPHLAGFRIVAQDLPAHGRSTTNAFSMNEALADADAVVAELGLGLPIIIGQSLGGYLGLRYAATRGCSAWIGLDGPFGLEYPWAPDDPGAANPISCEIRAIDVASDLAALKCPAMLMLCSIAAGEIEERMIPSRRALAEHIVRYHSAIRVEWIPTGHDMLLFERPQEVAGRISEFLQTVL